MSTLAGGRTEAILDIIFGYVISIYLSRVTYTNFSDILPLSILVGGFISAFFYYVKPVERLIAWWSYGRHYGKVFWSPYLRSARATIVAGTYVSIAAFLAIVTNATQTITIVSPAVSLQMDNVIFVSGLGVFLVTVWEGYQLRDKIRLVDYYLKRIKEGDWGEELVKLLEQAIREGDWEKARIMKERWEE